MSSPTLQLEKTNVNGKVFIRMTVKNATPELGKLLSSVGMIRGVEHLVNDYTNTYSTPQELDAARNPIKALFGHKGEWLGKKVA